MDRMLSRGSSYYKRLLAIPAEKILCIDTETTGLDPRKDEIIQLSMIDGHGKSIFESLICPPTRKRWPNAQEINGITPKMVKGKPELEEVADQVQEAINAADLIVGYNLPFDISMMEAEGFDFSDKEQYDLMEDYAQVFGRWSSAKDDYLWTKLTTAAKHYGIKFAAHDAGEDARATIKLFYAMLSDPEFMAAAVAKDRAYVKIQKETERATQERKVQKTTCLIVVIILMVFFGIIILSIISWLSSCVRLLG